MKDKIGSSGSEVNARSRGEVILRSWIREIMLGGVVFHSGGGVMLHSGGGVKLQYGDGVALRSGCLVTFSHRKGQQHCDN